MTVETIKRRFLYEANGTNKNYPIEFEYVDKQDVKVFTVDEYGTETEILDIYVTGNTVVAPNSAEPFPSGTTVKVERTLEYKQLDDYTQQGAFSPEDMERTADRNVMLLQQIRDVANDVEEYVEEGVGRFDEWKRDAETAAANSIAAKDTAVQAKDDALIAQGQAVQAKDEAESAIDKAKAWATKEDDPVEGTLFSAKYYADEVSQNTTEAQTARDEAVSAKDNAELAEGNASASAVAANTAKTDTLLAKAAAEQAKTDAQTAKGQAESAKTAAETAKGQAETAENKAKDWAGKTGSPVEGTLYSAKHYAESINYATEQEVLDGTDETKLITPATLQSKVVGNVANGAIMESGSNANGNWVRRADGTLECYFYEEHASSTLKFIQVGSSIVWYCGNQNKIFPHAFYEHSPISVSPGIMALGTGAIGYATCYGKTSTYASFSYVDFIDRSNQAYKFSYKAIGRWKA